MARTTRRVLLGAFLITAGSTTAMATEGGGSLRAFGVDTVLSGVMGSPGSARLSTFLAYYDANNTLDGSGNDRPGITNFGLTAEAIIARVNYVWNDVELWGANIESRIALPYANLRLKFDVQTPGGRVHRESTESGFGDALYAPVILGWHTPRYHQMAGIYLYLPTGDYDPTRLANPGRGYFGWAPVYWLTWFPTDALEVSGNLTYVFNSKNPDTHYTSGNEAGLDYGIGYAATDTWQLGVSGYLYKQMTDDKVHGQVVGDGNKGQAVAIGPFVRYHPSPNFGITFKWQYETEVENRTQGNRFILQFMYRLW